MSGSKPQVMRLLLPLVAVWLALPPAALPCEYRSIDPRHTMCAFGARQCPGKNMLRTGGLTCQDKEIILDTHNMLRQKVSLGQVRNQPAALNMRALMWDEELAKVAQRWADQCMPGHDRARNVVRFPVGQNVAATWTYEVDEGDTPDFPTQIEAWFNEVNQHGFAKGSVDPFRFSKATGHYTQMVWAETYLVGCGYAYYKDPSLGYTKIYVCNYGPGGNVIGGSMYKLGFPGQQYCVNDGLHPSQAYQGLCDRDAVSQPGPCGNTFKHTPSPPVSNSISSGHSMMPPPPPPTRHHNMAMPPPQPMMLSDEYMDHEDRDVMRPGNFLSKGIHEPIMGLMKIFNPWKLMDHITG